MRMQARNAMRIYVDKPQTTKTVFAADLNLAGSVIKKLAVLKMVIPPISTDLRSRTVMQPWPDAALG